MTKNFLIVFFHLVLAISSFAAPLAVELKAGPLARFAARAHAAFLDGIDPMEHAHGYDVRGDQSKGLANALPEFGGHYLDLCATYWEKRRDDAALKNGRKVVAAVEKNIDAEGYFGGETPQHRLARFSVWNQSHTVYGLARFAVATGDATARKLALAGADWIVRSLSALEPKALVDPASVGNGGSQNLCLMLALEHAARLEAKPAYADFLKRFLTGCEKTKMNLLSAQKALDLQSHKGIEMMVGYRGVLAYGMRAGDRAAVAATVRYWRDLARTQLRNTGGATSHEWFVPGGNEPARLDVRERPNETCVAAGWVRFSREIADVEGSAEPADEMERSLFNHLLGSASEDGLDFAYYQGNFGKKVFRRNAAYNCCRYRGQAVAAHLNEFLFRKDGDKVHALVYADAVCRDEGLVLEETTAYPADGTICFRATCGDKARTLVLRTPRWCGQATLSVDGRAVQAPPAGQTVDVTLAANKTTEIVLTLEMKFVRKACTIGGRRFAEYSYGPLLLVRDTHDGDKLGEAIPADAAFVRETDADGALVRFAAKGTDGRVHRLVDFASAGRHAPDRDEFEVFIPVCGEEVSSGSWYYKPCEYEAWMLQCMRAEADRGVLNFGYPGKFMTLKDEPKAVWSETPVAGMEPIPGDALVPPHRRERPLVEMPLAFVDGHYDVGHEDIGYVYVNTWAKPPRLFVGESLAELANSQTNGFEQSTEMTPVGIGCWRSVIPLALRYFRFEKPVAKERVVFRSQVDWRAPQGAFACGDARKEKMWQTGVETLRCCTRTFLVDGIKRDRLPWAADLAVEILAEAYSFGDPEPVKRTLAALGSGEPKKGGNVNGIASFSMWWVIAHDLLQRYFAEGDFLKLHYPRIRNRMDELATHEDARGFFTRNLGWNFMDWTGRDSGQLKSEISLQIIYHAALRAGVRLADRVGDAASAARWTAKAETLKAKILAAGMDGTRHSRILAIALDLVDGETAKRYAAEIAADDLPPTVTPYMSTFEVMALVKGGETAAALKKFESVWGAMTDFGVNTYWEGWDATEKDDERYVFYSRPFGKSLCHAWASGPVFLIPGLFLGIEPDGDGWRQIRVAPRIPNYAPGAKVKILTKAHGLREIAL